MKKIYATAFEIKASMLAGEQVGLRLDNLTAQLRETNSVTLADGHHTAVQALILLGEHGLRIADHLARTSTSPALLTRWALISDEVARAVQNDSVFV